MKTKKLLAMLIACAMMFSLATFSSFAAPPSACTLCEICDVCDLLIDYCDGIGTCDAANAGADPCLGHTPSGGGSGPDYDSQSDKSDNDGTTVFVNHIIDIDLPTDNAFDFILDPMGLMDIEEDATVNFDELVGGKIVPVNDAGLIMNFSSLPVIVTIDLEFTGTGLTVVDNVAAVEDEDGALNALLYVVPSASAITDSGIDLEEDFAPSGTGFAVEDESELTFLLDAAPYKVTRTGPTSFDFELVDDNTGFGTALQVGGWVNTQADWSAFADDATLNIVFTITAVDEEEVDATAGIYGFVSSDMSEVAIAGGSTGGVPTGFIAPGGGFPVGSSATLITRAAATADFVIPFQFNGATITSVSNVPVSTGTPAALPQGGTTGNRYTVTGAGAESGSFTITLASAAARDVIITLSNGNTYTVKFTV